MYNCKTIKYDLKKIISIARSKSLQIFIKIVLHHYLDNCIFDYFITALVHSGLGERQANSFLSELNIPAFSYKLVSARLREVGNVVEEVAKESTNEALEKELAAVEQYVPKNNKN